MAQQQTEKTPQWAQACILKAREEQLTELDLSGWNQEEKLTAVPDAIAQLTNLKELKLSGNRLTTVSDSVAQLSNLRVLNLSNNRLITASEAITQLSKLEWLNLNDNELTAIPDSISQLTNLQSLLLGGNQLTAIPDSISQLTNLRDLNLSTNQLMAIPDSISRLINLQDLKLGDNQLTKLPEAISQLSSLQLLGFGGNPLTTIPEFITKLTNLRELNLRGNQLSAVLPLITRLTKLQSLSLTENQLTAFPDAIIQLTNLRKLSLHGNRLPTIPDSIRQFKKLQELFLGSNQLTNIPEAIAELSNLRGLYLHDNSLTAMPRAVTQLANLQNLTLGGNQIKSVLDDIAKLKSLRRLNLGDNRLTSVPDTIAKLKNLRFLELNDNQLTTVPQVIARLINLQELNLSGNQLKTLPNWLVDLPNLNKLYLANNPIETPPPEILKSEVHESENLEALRAYFRQQKEEGESPIYEAKLLIVGEPGAGKTSLTRRLIDPAAPLPAKDQSTQGIDVHTWRFPLSEDHKPISVNHESVSDLGARIVSDAKRWLRPFQSSTENLEFQVNIWDFGGQEIYHATHQFFLTRRSLYIVVADAREQKTDFFHWLDLIEHLSDRSPVLIFNNAFQNRHWAINERQLQAHFPDTFQKPFAFNLADDKAGLAYLRQKIQEHVIHLPHVGDVLPRTWVNVRRALENDTRATVTQQEFLQLCKDNEFSRIHDGLQLSSYLHDLGVILHFQDDPLLKRMIILKPEWGTDAVYRVLDNEQVKANLGLFSRANLSDIWFEDEYALLHDELLALMMKFQLCYAIPNQKDWYIAPQLLSEQPPDYDLTVLATETTKRLFLRYKYEAFMPKGLLTRLIVVMHPHIATNDDQQLVWRTGVVLEKDGARAEVVEFYHRREIRIQVAGKNVRDLLTVISYQLDELHRPFHRLKFDKLIPCNCATCSTSDDPNFFRLDVLRTRLEHSKSVIECDVPPFETVQIRSLLDDVGAATQSVDLPTLLRMLNRDFDDDEFRTLCLELGVNYDNLSGGGLEGKQRELLLKLERNGRLPELINLLRQKRPNFNW